MLIVFVEILCKFAHEACNIIGKYGLCVAASLLKNRYAKSVTLVIASSIVGVLTLDHPKTVVVVHARDVVDVTLSCNLIGDFGEICGIVEEEESF